MNPASLVLPSPKHPIENSGNSSRPRWQSYPALPLALTIALGCCVFLPRVAANPNLVWAISGVAGALLVWQLILWAAAKRGSQTFRIEFVPVKSHYVQAAVQFCLIVYWGWFARDVYAQLPLILAQLIFLYAFDALLSWSRGRSWRLGFGPLPIIFSTNLLLWFKDDWFLFQFLMVATGALAKQFITWEHEGKRTHIFNPSAFGQSLFALALIATGTTNDLTWGREIATSFETPHMLIVIFLGGLLVQYLFHVTLMTLSAVGMLCVLNLAYTKITGTYLFVNIHIAAPIFLGVHLLVTDPATSPRTNLGRVLFGALYGLGYATLFWVLALNEVPVFWDKLLPVPILNLCVPLIDRWARSGIPGRLNRRWETVLSLGKLNAVHMGCWVALFATMVGSSFVDAPHPGNSIPFWKKAYAEGKPLAGPSLVMAAGSQAEGSGSAAAFNELGLICMEGKIVKQNRVNAAHYFAKACELGDPSGCANVAAQFLFLHELRSEEDVERALNQIEKDCNEGASGLNCYLLGSAYESGQGRPLNKKRATELYQIYGPDNLYACKGLARIALSGSPGLFRIKGVAPTLEKAAEANDTESCWYLAYMYHRGKGVPRDEQKARAFLEKACTLGSKDACEAIGLTELPPFSKPLMSAPAWSTSEPTQ